MFAGDGGDRARMEQKARKKEVSERIHFVGSLDDVRPAYAAMDAYVFLCQHEPFGLVLAEAMASGVPLFGLHGLGEYRALDPPLINDNVATFFEREDPERFLDPEEEDVPESDEILGQLREALLSFDPSSPEGRKQIKAAQEHVRTHFDVSIQAQRMTTIYQNVVDGAAG
jgi:glycosyltransferase involved in cell wall biosynthesis